VPQAQFRSLLSHLGSGVTDRQLERWRNEGLLPKAIQTPTYGHDGRVAGSTVKQLRSAALQVIAIERTLGTVRSIDRAGAVLWTAGYEVDERYWRPTLVHADNTGRLVSRWASALLGRMDYGPTFGERVAEMHSFSGVLHTVARKAGRRGLARGADLAVEVAGGDFAGFALPASDRDEADRKLAERALGFDAGGGHNINGQRLQLGTDLAAILKAMSGHMPLAELTDSEIDTARDDARNTLKVVYCLYGATDWIFGRRAFGLLVGAGLVRAWPLALIQALAISFARLRRKSKTLLESREIADLATEAERVWLMSMWLRDIYEGNCEGAKIVTPKRMRSALTDSASHRNLLRELASHELAKREFRPWDQWRKSAGKTMSPGLLAMSIGAPETIAFDDLVGSMSARAIR
tara:strand:+ start:4329 stop:5549 length:1221 start_codon:yes stop_codon:yes gene_type:complete